LNLPLARAQAYADKIVRELAPFCARIAIAGSIRRRRPICHDIDLVLIPRDAAGLHDRVFQAAARRLCCGEQVLRVELKTGVQLDIYMAHEDQKDLFCVAKPCNWGSLLLCRTGSKEHNIKLVQRAAGLGYRWDPHNGVYNGDGTCIASATEEDIFQALESPYVNPEART
jgi:DNA polymerase (family 10)